MFESDQHEFDEVYAEGGHPAPPFPPKPVTPPEANEPLVEGEEAEDEGEFHYEEMEQEEYVDPAQHGSMPVKKKPNLILWAAVAFILLFAVLVILTLRPKQSGQPAGDMGPGIVAASGLRGHLNTRWEGDRKSGSLMYQLQIEPMQERWGAGFTRVTTNPPIPISVNIRLLDETGFALCGKEIDFRFDPQNAALRVAAPLTGPTGKRLSQAERNTAMQAARQSEIAQLQAAEAVRERGKDIFQNQTTADGQVTAVHAQGVLPCSPDQYKRANYWDLNTNFPTLDEQTALIDPKAAAAAAAAKRAQEFEPPAHPTRRASAKGPQQGFLIQGDDRVSGYDSVRGVLLAEGKAFQIDKRAGYATAMNWANNYSLIHYKCDQQANCALTAAGGLGSLRARMVE